MNRKMLLALMVAGGLAVGCDSGDDGTTSGSGGAAGTGSSTGTGSNAGTGSGAATVQEKANEAVAPINRGASETGAAVQSGANDAATSANNAATSAGNAAGGAISTAKDAASDVAGQTGQTGGGDAAAKGEQMLGQVMEHIKNNRWDAADTALKQVEGMRAQLPASLHPRIDQARQMVNTGRAGGAAGQVQGMLGK